MLGNRLGSWLETSRDPVDFRWRSSRELRREAGAVPPPLSVLTLWFQPRRCYSERSALLSSSEGAADCWMNWRWRVVAAWRAVVGPARGRRCEFVNSFRRCLRRRELLDATRCSVPWVVTCTVFCTRCCVRYYFFPLWVNVAVIWNYVASVTWLSLVRALFCFILRICPDSKSLWFAYLRCHNLPWTVSCYQRTNCCCPGSLLEVVWTFVLLSIQAVLGAGADCLYLVVSFFWRLLYYCCIYVRLSILILYV